MFVLKCLPVLISLSSAIGEDSAKGDATDLTKQVAQDNLDVKNQQDDIKEKVERAANDSWEEETDYDEITPLEHHESFIDNFLSVYPIDAEMPAAGNVGMWKYESGLCPESRVTGSKANDLITADVTVINMATKKIVAELKETKWVVSKHRQGYPLLHTLFGMYICDSERRTAVIRSEDAVSLELPVPSERTLYFVDLVVKDVEIRDIDAEDESLEELAEETLMLMMNLFGDTDLISDNDSIPYETPYADHREKVYRELKDIKMLLLEHQEREANSGSVEDVLKQIDSASPMTETEVSSLGSRARLMVQTVSKPLRAAADWIINKAISVTVRDEL